VALATPAALSTSWKRYRVQREFVLEEFRRVLRECGMGLIGQTAEIAPADKKIYALRDVTSTVENIGLICGVHHEQETC